MLLADVFGRRMLISSAGSTGEFSCSTDLEKQKKMLVFLVLYIERNNLDKMLVSADPTKLFVLIGDGVALHSFKLDIAVTKTLWTNSTDKKSTLTLVHV